MVVLAYGNYQERCVAVVNRKKTTLGQIKTRKEYNCAWSSVGEEIEDA